MMAKMSLGTQQRHRQYDLRFLATTILLVSQVALGIATPKIGQVTRVNRRLQSSHHQQQQHVIYNEYEETSKYEYPTDLRYTENHIWFGPDTNKSLTRIGLTSYPLTTPTLLNNSLDGGAIYLDRHDPFEADEIIARFVYSPDWDDPSKDRDFAVHAPYAGVWHAPNLDLDLDGMVREPYSDVAFIGTVEGGMPRGRGRDGVRFLDAKEYEEFVKGLRGDVAGDL